MSIKVDLNRFVDDGEYRELFCRGYQITMDEDLYDVLSGKAEEVVRLHSHLLELDGDKTHPFYIGALQAFDDHRNDCCQHWKHVDSKYCCFHSRTRKVCIQEEINANPS